MGDSGGISLQERLASVDASLKAILTKLDDGSTRITRLETECDGHVVRIAALEGSRDWILRVVVGAVILSVLGVIGITKYGH